MRSPEFSTPGWGMTARRAKLIVFVRFLALLGCGMLLGALTGGLMSAINIEISHYFYDDLFPNPIEFAEFGTPEFDQAQRYGEALYGNIIRSGLTQGLFFGLVMAGVFTVFVLYTSRASCGFKMAFSYLLRIVALMFLFWIAGAVSGAMTNIAFPGFLNWYTDYFDDSFEQIDINKDGFTVLFSSGLFWDLSKYAAVVGANWAVYLGIVPTLIIICHWFEKGWQRFKSNQERSSL